MAKIKLTAKQKEALSYTPLHLCWSETNTGSSSWSTSWTNTKYFTMRTIDSLVDKGLLDYPPYEPGGHASRDKTERILTQKALDMGFVENEGSKENEHTIKPKEKKPKKLESGELKKGKLFYELEVLRIIAEKEGLNMANDFLHKLIYVE